MEQNNTTAWVPVSEIKIFPGNESRTHFYDNDAAPLVEMIKTSGMDALEPIIVKKTSKGYTLVTGEMTIDAVQQAIAGGLQIESIKCTVVEHITHVEELFLQFTEVNGQKLHTFDSARLVSKLAELGVKNVEISNRTGINQARIPFFKRIDTLPVTVKRGVSRHKITLGEITAIFNDVKDPVEQEEKFNALAARLKQESRKDAAARFAMKHRVEKPVTAVVPELSLQHKAFRSAMKKVDKSGLSPEKLELLNNVEGVLTILDGVTKPSQVAALLTEF